MQIWDKILTIFQTESGRSSLTATSARTQHDGFQLFMEEYAKQQASIPKPSGTGQAGSTSRRPIPRSRSRGGTLGVVWRAYRWRYPHSAWASPVCLSDAEPSNEHNNASGLSSGASGKTPSYRESFRRTRNLF